MPIVNVQITKGARRAEKAQIVAEFTETLKRVLGQRQENIHILIQEVDESNWGHGGTLVDEFRSSATTATAPTPYPVPPPPVAPPPVPLPVPTPAAAAYTPPPAPPVAPPVFAPAETVVVAPEPVVSSLFTPSHQAPAGPVPVAAGAPEQSAGRDDVPPPRHMLERTPGAKEEEIYVDMMSGGFACLRSVMAENLGRDVYRIIEDMPENEAWKYGPGAVVRVKKQKLSTGKALVAYEEVYLKEVR